MKLTAPIQLLPTPAQAEALRQTLAQANAACQFVRVILPETKIFMPVEVAVCNLMDERGIRSAMMGVDTVYHLAGVEWHGAV